MKKNTLLLFFVLAALALTAQPPGQHYKYVGVSVQPHYALRFLSSSNTMLKDSLNSVEKNRGGYSFSIQFGRQLSPRLWLQTGLQYTNIGFIRVVSNLDYRTRIHPDLPPLDQTILTVPNPTAELNYVFDYLDIPVLFNSRVYFGTRQNKQWDFYVTYGASLNILMQDRVAVRLKGFTIDNDRSFNIENTYLKSNYFNATGHLGFRADFNYSNKLSFFSQPILNVPVLPATRGELTYRFISVGLQVGAFYNISLKNEEEVIIE